MLINKKRINSLNEINKATKGKYNIGIHVTSDEYKKIGLSKFENGLTIEPSAEFGINCNKNTNGYSYPDKTKPKEKRVINTRYWTWEDWGHNLHSEIVDIPRMVYPRVEVPSANIEFQLMENTHGDKYIIANIDENTSEEIKKQTINMFLEIYGYFEIVDEDLYPVRNPYIKRCNWQILLPSVREMIITKYSKKNNNTNKDSYLKERLTKLDSYNPAVIYEGLGGFSGYYAYVFDKICILESPIYGNATYIVPKDRWEELSKMSKKDVLNDPDIIDKYNHDTGWLNKIDSLMKKY